MFFPFVLGCSKPNDKLIRFQDEFHQLRDQFVGVYAESSKGNNVDDKYLDLVFEDADFFVLLREENIDRETRITKISYGKINSIMSDEEHTKIYLGSDVLKKKILFWPDVNFNMVMEDLAAGMNRGHR